MNDASSNVEVFLNCRYQVLLVADGWQVNLLEERRQLVLFEHAQLTLLGRFLHAVRQTVGFGRCRHSALVQASLRLLA